MRALTSGPGEGPLVFAQRFCTALCPKRRLPAQPVYGGNDWYFRYGHISADTVRQDSALIRDLSPQSDNLPFYVIDDGWYSDAHDRRGPYELGNTGFPDMPGLAAQMRGNEIRPGIWIRPLLTGAIVPDGWKMPAGRPHDLAGDRVYLDPSVPDVLALVRRDIARMREWGFEMIKHDFTTYDALGRWGRHMGASITADGWSFSDQSRTTAEILLELYEAIREAAGDVTLIGCNTIGHLGAGLFELQRIGDDTSGKIWEQTRKMGVNSLAFRMNQQGTFYAADADCVGLTNAIPWSMNSQWLDLLSRSGTPLFVSADPGAVGPEQRKALAEAFARAAKPMPPAEPLDWLETTCPRHWRTASGEITYDWLLPEGTVFGSSI
jgi:alpha-galactosidase